MNNANTGLSISRYLQELTQNKKLQLVLGATNSLYAGEANKTPLYVHALILNSYIESAWRFVDGSSQITKYLTRQIRKHGGTLVNYSKVKKFIHDQYQIKAALTESGEAYEAKYFISNIEPSQTIDILDGFKLRKSYINRINALEDTISVFILHLVVKPGTIYYLNYNHYHFRENCDIWTNLDYTENEWAQQYFLLTPATSKTDQYAETVSIMTYMKYNEVAEWKNTFHTKEYGQKRGEAYETFKTKKAEKLLHHVFQKFPELKNNILHIHAMTPLTFRDYIGNKTGSLYGIAKDCNNPLKTHISNKTKIPNLLLTGQSTQMHGILGVSISAIYCCTELIGTNFLLDI